MDSNSEQTVIPKGQQVDSSDEETTIDLGRILRALWHYIWLIVAVTFLGAIIMFACTKLFITNMYTSSATLYVSNSNTTTITSSDSNVAEVVSTVISSPDTINLAIEDGNLTIAGGLTENYTYKMISSALTVTVGEAGILTFSVELADPQDAYKVANAIIEALDTRAQTNEGGENIFKESLFYSVVTNPRVPTTKSSPNTMQNTLIGALAGAVLSCAVIVVFELLNNRIYNNDYLTSTFNLPVLTEIPDFSDKRISSEYSSYSTPPHYGYGVSYKQ